MAMLEDQGQLLKSADGKEYYPSRRRPHRQVDLRGAGDNFTIVSHRTGESRGEIDCFRAFRETHPGAVYLHHGETYRVDALDLEARTVGVTKARFDYYTRVRGFKETDILEEFQRKNAWGAVVSYGRLKVTDQVTGL